MLIFLLEVAAFRLSCDIISADLVCEMYFLCVQARLHENLPFRIEFMLKGVFKEIHG